MAPKAHAIVAIVHAMASKAHAIVPIAHAMAPKAHAIVTIAHAMTPKAHAIVRIVHAIRWIACTIRVFLGDFLKILGYFTIKSEISK
ncbi:MAG: hypothetical protein IPP77_14845 [Bacteroidetes bacterium]|nr:hypothetical protein [Bacteroidota bacterium]